MSIQEACRRSNYRPFTLRMFCRNGTLIADKPLGNRGGWDINEPYFEKWLRELRAKRSNSKARELRRAA